MTITDVLFSNYAICSLRDDSRQASLVETAAVDLSQWAMLEAFNGRTVPLSVYRRKYDQLWNLAWTGPRDGADYWTGIRAGRSVSKKVFEFLDAYEIIQPQQSYKLPVDEHLIIGEYAVVQKRGSDQRWAGGPMILMRHLWRPRCFRQPNIRALVCWLHAMRTGRYMNLGIYNLTLVRSKSWKQYNIRESLVRQWIEAIMASLQQVKYPVPGSQCETCASESCLEVFGGV